MKGKFLAVIILVIVALIAVVLINQDRTTEEQGNQIEEFAAGGGVPGFPDEVSLPEEFEALRSFTSTSPEGRLQATKVIESEMSLAETFTFYRDFFEESENWEVVGEVNNPEIPTHRALFAENGAGVMNLNMNGDETGTVTDLSFTYNQ